MIVIEKDLPKKDGYPVLKLTKGFTPVLFDIETTGLAADNSFLYLIGALMIKNDRLIFKQWFSEGPKDEADVINSFFSWLPDTTCLIHFNGRGFDVPYLSKKCKKLGISCILPQLPNIDLYRSFAPLKDFFNMDSRRLVAYERLIGLEREDQFNGGELIDVYKEFVGRVKFDKEGADKLKHFLLLHNEEDILDMVPVLDLFAYMDLLVGNVSDATWEVADSTLKITVKAACQFPTNCNKPLVFSPDIPNGRLEVNADTATFTIPIINCRLKHFYEDYRNYYYLPEEDMAIHKNVADSVSKEFRQQATKETAYTWTESDFVPQPNKGLEPYFSKSYKAPLNYVPVKLINSTEKLSTYIKALF